ncbi:chemotaxis protein CheB [Myxosarcina sp. GI1]|uniref:chemotaxis protein CheB n=1 Tax=Myxosarcina sp. GI1 TaxID=1541065 RepID=UPI00068B7762|nr:chemotaxis protein CheB [Myxosarcina sp. GI1]
MSGQYKGSCQPETNNKNDNAIETAKDNFYVVGIGASAGGLNALKELFGRLPADSGAAFVVIQHLSPDYKSLMKELLQQHTEMIVYRTIEGMELQPNSVYLIPPDKNLTLEGNLLHLEPRSKNSDRQPNFPIDIFFKSLAKNFARQTIGVILSGSGSDGSQGIRVIKEAGGVTIVQEPATAEFDGMPLSAIDTGVVDRIVPLGEIPHQIYQCLNTSDTRADSSLEQNNWLATQQLNAIIDLLSETENLDFSHYKTNTISRRIERRRSIANLDNIDNYIHRLKISEAERKKLVSDLLINVTHFFRDKPAWDNLKNQILPLLVEQVTTHTELRFWVTACSTGEEAYSLAILIDEVLADLPKQISYKIFATDIDRHALQKASRGIYSPSIANDVGTERLQKYFVAKDNSYQVIRRIRNKIIFSLHDLTSDAGFTRMHFVSCRNVLIYLQPKLQNFVLRNLHFSLVTKGVLFLGEAETVETFAKEFKVLDRKWKIYQKQRDIRLSLPLKEKRQVAPKNLLGTIQPVEKHQLDSILEQSLKGLLAESQSIALIVDRDDQLLRVCGDSKVKIFKPPSGKITTKVTKMVVSDLQLPLNAALHRARKEQKTIFYRGIKLNLSDKANNISLKVIPLFSASDERHGHSSLSSSKEKFCLVQIQEEISLFIETAEKFEINNEAQKLNLELEQELQHTRGNLQTLVEELEFTNEEQQASNEELTAANEELQSTNEELQSTNEELHTVNREYQYKIQELIELNNDIDNLLKSTDIGVIFLDRDLKIRKFTPAATEAVALRNEDIDRPIEELSLRIECPDLQDLLVRVLEDKQTIEREVKLKQNDSYLLMRVNLYITEEGNDDGIVISFVKLDEIKKVQQQLKTTLKALSYSEARLNLALSAADIGTWTLEASGKLIGDDRFCQLYGIDRQRMPNSFAAWLEIIEISDRQRVKKQIQTAFKTQKSCRVEYRVFHPNGNVRWLVTKGKFYRQQNLSEGRMAGVTIDITEIRQTEAALRSREAELKKLNQDLELRVEERTATLAEFGNSLKQLHRLATTNYSKIEDLFDDYLQTGCNILKLTTGVICEIKNNSYKVLAVKSPLNFTVGKLVYCQAPHCNDVIQRQQTVAYAQVNSNESIEPHLLYSSFPLQSFIGTPIFVNGVLFGTLNFFDTTAKEQKFKAHEREIIELMARDIGQSLATIKAKKALKESEARFRSTFEQAAVGIAHVATTGRFISVNQRFCQIVGYSVNELTQITFQKITYPQDLARELKYVRLMLEGEIETYSLEKRYIHRNNSLVWVNLTVSSVKKDSGKLEYFIAVIEDIGDRKQAEMALQESKEKLQRANLAKDTFIAHVSHELRTPLNSILGFSHIVKQGSNLTPEQSQNIDIVYRCGQHLLMLINDILDFSKIEANKLELETKEFNLIDFLQTTTAIFQLRTREQGIEFDYQTIYPLPQIVNSDETRLRQVLFNLLSNAVKFTQAGKVTFTVGYVSNLEPTASSTATDLLRFQIEDTGIGIPEDKLTSIFLPFVQLNGNCEQQEGTGLGLTIAQNIVRLMGSQIYLESTAGKGSKFWFDLKLSEARANITYSPSTRKFSTRSSGKLQQPCKVLIVDDNLDNCRLLRSYLQPLGFIVEEANNGKTGLVKAKSFKPDAILLDWVMPEMDGRETIVKIRQQPELQQLKIFVVSANRTIVSTTSEIDYQGFLSKPVDSNKLVELLEINLNLTWKISDRAESFTPPAIDVPVTELSRLLELADLGDLEAVQQQLEDIAAQNSKYTTFVKQTKQITASCQQHKLVKFITQFL